MDPMMSPDMTNWLRSHRRLSLVTRSRGSLVTLRSIKDVSIDVDSPRLPLLCLNRRNKCSKEDGASEASAMDETKCPRTQGSLPRQDTCCEDLEADETDGWRIAYEGARTRIAAWTSAVGVARSLLHKELKSKPNGLKFLR